MGFIKQMITQGRRQDPGSFALPKPQEASASPHPLSSRGAAVEAPLTGRSILPQKQGFLSGLTSLGPMMLLVALSKWFLILFKTQKEKIYI